MSPLPKPGEQYASALATQILLICKNKTMLTAELFQKHKMRTSLIMTRIASRLLVLQDNQMATTPISIIIINMRIQHKGCKSATAKLLVQHYWSSRITYVGILFLKTYASSLFTFVNRTISMPIISSFPFLLRNRGFSVGNSSEWLVLYRLRMS